MDEITDGNRLERLDNHITNQMIEDINNGESIRDMQDLRHTYDMIVNLLETAKKIAAWTEFGAELMGSNEHRFSQRETLKALNEFKRAIEQLES